MSESPQENPSSHRRRSKLLFIVVILTVIILPMLVYAGGDFFFPGMGKTAYQNGDCETVLSRDALYRRLYPVTAGYKSNSNSVTECAVYSLATSNEDAGKWRDSFNAFRVYSDAYPQGYFVTVSHERGAIVLMELIKEEMSQNKFTDAVGEINFLLNEYGDTSVAVDAEKIKVDILMAFGVELRESGGFAGAEQIFKEINAGAQDNNDAEIVRSSQLELAQTYLAWGDALLSQDKFAEANVKFDLAASTDPDPSSASGPSAQANAGRVGLYSQWGDYLVAQKDFANAMKRYETAGILLEKDDPVAAKDIVAGGYVQWAKEAYSEEDFLGALVLLDFAQANSEAAITKRLVDDTRANLYQAFSYSEGGQAKRAMEDAVQIVCEHHTQPSLPIFGKDGENKLAGIYGVEDRLPKSVAAKTPASLHYTACIDEDTKLVGTLTLPISATQFGGPPGVVQITYANYQYVWNVVLRYVDTGDEILTTVIEGVPPADLIPFNIDITTFSYFGARPNIEDLANLIADVAK